MSFGYFSNFYSLINSTFAGFGNYTPDFELPQWFSQPTFTPTFDFSQCRFSNTDTFERTIVKKEENKDPFAAYNKTNGEKLSSYVKTHATGFDEGCAKAVSDALVGTKLSNGQRGHAWQMKNILRNNKHFKEVPVSSVTDTTSIPKGAILVYDKGACGYNKEYGHVEVTIGNGKAASDGIHNIKGMPNAVFIPV